eukprot:1160513-Pelagomonas_calceolata.AAC.28
MKSASQINDDLLHSREQGINEQTDPAALEKKQARYRCVYSVKAGADRSLIFCVWKSCLIQTKSNANRDGKDV